VTQASSPPPPPPDGEPAHPDPEDDIDLTREPAPNEPADFPSLENEITLPPEEPSPPPRRRGLTHDFATRGLVLMWCLWLLGSWSLTMGVKPVLPNIRYMVLSAAIGFLVLWPLLRLSQQVVRLRYGVNEPDAGGPAVLRAEPVGRGASAGTIFADWLSLLAVFQAVLWPLPLTTGWSIQQALWLDAAMAAWSLLVAAIVALGCAADSPVRRTIAMVLVLALLVGEPVVMAVMNLHAERGGGVTWLMRVSPLQAIWEMTSAPIDWRPQRWAERVIAVACAAVVAWGIVGVMRRRNTDG
jgi:hypothetical protein